MTVTIVDKCEGLNTILDPMHPVKDTDQYGRPIPSPHLAKAVNIRITDSNKIELGPGFTKLEDLTAGHSLFCDNGPCLVHDGGSMYEVAADLSLSAAKRTGMSGNKLDHAQYGQAIYFGNRQEKGVYYGGASLAWDVDTYNGPPTDRQFETSVPLFNHLAGFNGYILGSIDNALFACEIGKPGLWEMKPIWMSDTDIIMIKAVASDGAQPFGGIFVSDTKRQFFLSGLDPRNLAEGKVADYPAIEWGVAHGYADASDFSDASGRVGAWFSRKGLCLGTAQGGFTNVMHTKIAIPSTGTAGACLIKGHNIISILR